MQRRKLRRSNLEVSALGLGSWVRGSASVRLRRSHSRLGLDGRQAGEVLLACRDFGYAIEQPDDVDINEILLRPIVQEL